MLFAFYIDERGREREGRQTFFLLLLCIVLTADWWNDDALGGEKKRTLELSLSRIEITRTLIHAKKNGEYSIGAAMDIFLISQSTYKWEQGRERRRNITYYPRDRTMLSVVFEN